MRDPHYLTAYADWSSREYGAAVRCVVTARTHEGPAPAQLAQCLQAMYTPSSVRLLNYAHHGIAWALAWFARQQPARREVIVPAYICPSVPQTVRAAGLTVRCVPVGDDLNLTVEGVRGALGPATLAVIAPHMYGCPAPIEDLEVLCRESGVFLLDDAAQVVGERASERLLGTFGDVGVISFAQSKAIVTGIRGSGGVLLVNRSQWMDEADRACAALAPANGRLAALADFLWNHLWHAHTGHSGYYLQRVRERLGIRATTPAGPTRISNLEAAVALVQLDRWGAMRQERLRVLNTYHETLRGMSGLSLPQYQPGRYLARVMVQLPPGVDGQEVRRRLAAAGVQGRAPYPTVPEAGQDPAGAARVQSLIGLPASSRLSATDIAAICAALHTSIVSAAPFSH